MAKKRSTNKAAERQAAAQAQSASTPKAPATPEKPKRTRPVSKRTRPLPKATGEQTRAKRVAEAAKSGNATREKGTFVPPKLSPDEIVAQGKARRERQEAKPPVTEVVKQGNRSTRAGGGPMTEQQRNLINISKRGAKGVKSTKTKSKKVVNLQDTPSDSGPLNRDRVATNTKNTLPKGAPEGATPVTTYLAGPKRSPVQGPKPRGR